MVDKTPGLGPSARSTGVVALERSDRLTNIESREAFLNKKKSKMERTGASITRQNEQFVAFKK